MMQPALQLHDIHLPDAAGWWPPAIGWWILAIIILSLLFWVSALAWQWLKYQSWRNKLLKEFNANIAVSNQDAHTQVTAITEALRRSALTLFPGNTVAHLTGTDWLEFLESHAENTPFTQLPGTLLIEAPYSDSVECDDGSVIKLRQMAMAWVKRNANRHHYRQLRKGRRS